MAAGLNEASLALAGESRAVLPPDPADTTGAGADAGLILEQDMVRRKLEVTRSLTLFALVFKV